MPNRRDVLRSGIALTGLPLIGHAAWRASDARVSRPHAPYRVLFDDRFAESRRFGAEVVRLGGAARGFAGDVTNLWYEELDVHWRQEPVAVAGMTRHGPLFCLERLAWDVGMRLVYRAEHRPTSDGEDWALRAAHIIMSCQHDSCALATQRLGSAALLADHDDPLISWVIAPRAQGRAA